MNTPMDYAEGLARYTLLRIVDAYDGTPEQAAQALAEMPTEAPEMPSEPVAHIARALDQALLEALRMRAGRKS
jgi:hypothetical protein